MRKKESIEMKQPNFFQNEAFCPDTRTTREGVNFVFNEGQVSFSEDTFTHIDCFADLGGKKQINILKYVRTIS